MVEDEPRPKTRFAAGKPLEKAFAHKRFSIFGRREAPDAPLVEEGETRRTMAAFFKPHAEEPQRMARFSSSHSAEGFFMDDKDDPRESVAAGFKKAVPGSGIVINPAVALYDLGAATYWGARYGFGKWGSITFRKVREKAGVVPAAVLGLAVGTISGLLWGAAGLLSGAFNAPIRIIYGQRKHTTANFIEQSRKDLRNRPWQHDL